MHIIPLCWLVIKLLRQTGTVSLCSNREPILSLDGDDKKRDNTVRYCECFPLTYLCRVIVLTLSFVNGFIKNVNSSSTMPLNVLFQTELRVLHVSSWFKEFGKPNTSHSAFMRLWVSEWVIWVSWGLIFICYHCCCTF